jgi:hypothetical protein
LTAAVTSREVTGIPTNSSTIYVRLYYLANGVWKTIDYQYTAAPPVPQIVSPPAGTQLPGATVTFTWTTNGAAVTEWRLLIGNTAGASDIYDSLPLAAQTLSTTVTGLPLDERQLFARLSYVIDGATSVRDFTYTAGRPSPEITSPGPDTVLDDSDVLFEWTTNGLAVTEWRLIVGNSEGANDLHDSGLLPATTLTRMVTGLPVDGRDLFAQLQFMIDGVWESKDFQYRAFTAAPEIEAPTPGSVLSGPDVTFTWTSNGVAVSIWRLYVGTSLGSSNLHYSGNLTADITSRDVTGIHTDGRTIYVRLYYLTNGLWKTVDYQYTAATFIPELSSPTPGTVLVGSDVTFTWTSNGAAVSIWRLYVGTGLGQSNIYYSGNLTADITSRDVTGIHTDGRTIYVRLYYLANGVWKTIDYQYTAATFIPELSSPTPGTVLVGSDVTFTWTSNGAAVSIWRLYVGTSPGSSNLHYTGNLASDVLSANVTGLPTDNRAIYVRLLYLLNGAWRSTDYVYTAADLVPALVDPTPGTVLSDSSVTFSWTSNGVPLTMWRLDVGTSPGSSNIYYSGALTADITSREVTGIPTNGSTVYVRLYYLANGVWKTIDYQYTASST